MSPSIVPFGLAPSPGTPGEGVAGDFERRMPLVLEITLTRPRVPGEGRS